ncbi:MAG: hypothetical protein ABSD78_16405 [Acidimicrobiales bacterium]|jgi:vacuolar-type H+-ATPase subunit F/Vma7
MGRVAVIGETVHVEGFALAGATVICTEDATGARDAWLTLADDTVLVVLTPMAAAAVGGIPASNDDVLTVVIPT